MAEIIKDGRTGDTAKVDVNNRMHVQALSVNAVLDSHLLGNAYIVGTGGFINLAASATEHALLYIKNTGDANLIIDAQNIEVLIPTGDDTECFLGWHMNPTGGTLISEEFAAGTVNRRIGSPINLSADTYKASLTGKTITGGGKISHILKPDSTRIYTHPWIIPKGQSFAMSYTTSSNVSDVDIQLGMLIIVDSTGIL